MKRSPEIFSAAPSVDWMTTMAVIGAQYASGSPKRRAIRKEAAAATAVRAELITSGQPSGAKEIDGREIVERETVERKTVERKTIGRTPWVPTILFRDAA